MATYITLIRYTERGIENIKEGPARLDGFKQMVRDAGGEFKEFYLVMGDYDVVLITEAPDDETMAKILLTLGSKASHRTETLRAFTEDEYRKIIASLP